MNRPTIFIESADGHIFSVDIAFLNKCQNPHLEHSYNLVNEYGMVKYLHNLTGPSVNKDGYFLLGEGLLKVIKYK